MKLGTLLVTCIALLSPMSGCLTETIDDNGIEVESDDKVLTIVTYDIYGLTSERISESVSYTHLTLPTIYSV